MKFIKEKSFLLRVSISKEILSTSIPLIFNVLSHPLYAMALLSIILANFPKENSNFILGAAIINVFIKFCESLLSGTRVLTSTNRNQDHIQKNILSNSITMGFLLSFILITISILFFLITISFDTCDHYKNLSKIILFISLGVPGNFLYSSSIYYLHAHKQTRNLPTLSWTINSLSIITLMLLLKVFSLSFYQTLLVISLTRLVLGVCSFFIIPSSLKYDIKVIFRSSKFLEYISIARLGISHAIHNLLFMGAYLLFTILLEMRDASSLAIFQIQINLLNIMSVVNMSIISSGCINFSQINNNSLGAKRISFEQNLFINFIVITIMLSSIFVFQKNILLFMSKGKADFDLFNKTFFLFCGIYIIDQIQSIFIQTMTYSNDYLVPPMIRIIYFCVVSIPSALLIQYTHMLHLEGILLSILTGSISSLFIILIRFRSRYHMKEI
ncbi:MAG: hypothetical protein EOP34_03490 [Rickettsiales bacterium]|nr:MAG: hypothetical protein EOP34_03490 [Rickettsiales bacterium]